MNSKRTATASILAILLAISLAALTSCQTCPEPVVEYRDRPMPAVAWPTVPDPAGKVERLPDGRVVMPLEYWLALTRYVIDVEAGIKIIEAAR